MRTILLTCVLAAAVPLAAQMNDEKSDESATRAATTGLATLRALAEKAPEVIGMNEKDAGAAQLRPPLRVMFVPLDKLKAYHGEEPFALLLDVKTYFYAVSVGAEVRSSITVKNANNTWTATEFGNQALAKRIAQVRGGATAAAMLVRIPALNLDFVGTESGGKLQLTSLFDVPGTDIRMGNTVDAAHVFAALVPMAQAHNGLPT